MFYDILPGKKSYIPLFKMIRIMVIPQGIVLNKAVYCFFVWVNDTKCNVYTKRI